MENMDKEGMGCGCHHHHGKHHLVKIILKLIIVIIIFWCGFEIGNITGAIKAETHGYGSMSRGGFQMMQGGFSNAIPVTGGATTQAPVPTK